MQIDTAILRTLGQIAGLGGICAGVFLLLFRDLLKRIVAPNLTKAQWFRIVVLFMVLVWSFAVFGIGAWVFAVRNGPAPSTFTLPTRDAPPGMKTVYWQRANASFLVPRTRWTLDDKLKEEAGDIYLRAEENPSAIINLHHMAYYGDRIGDWQKFVDLERQRLEGQVGAVTVKQVFIDSKKAVEFAFSLKGEKGRMKRAISTIADLDDEWYLELNYSEDVSDPYPDGEALYRNVIASFRLY